MNNINNLIKKFQQDKIITRFSKKNNICDLICCKELDISKLIAWLLDSNESHGLGSKFVNCFIEQLPPKKIKDISNNALSKATIITEYPIIYNKEKGRIDILIATDEICIVIENKFGSKEHNNQLSKYEKYFLDKIKNKKVDFIFVYLDINHEETENEKEINTNWIKLNYEWIVNFLSENISKASAKIKIILKEFKILIENSNNFDNHIDQLCLTYHDLIDQIELIRNKNLSNFIFDKESFELGLFKIYHQYQWVFDKLISRNKLYNQIKTVDDLRKKVSPRYSFIEYIRPTTIDFTHKKTENYATKENTYWPCYITLQQSDKTYTCNAPH